MIEVYPNLYTKILNLNLSKIRNSSYKMQNFIRDNIMHVNDSSVSFSNLPTTSYYMDYNIFLYPYPELYELFNQIKIMFHDLIDCDFIGEPHYMQAWINFYQKGDYINWHEHWTKETNSWHGYYCVNVEPSKTTYKFKDSEMQFDVHNKDNMLVFGRSNDMHRTWPWEYDIPRITIAFDIVPACYITRYVDGKDKTGINHWIPI